MGGSRELMSWRFPSGPAAQNPRRDSAPGTRAYQLGGLGGNHYSVCEADLGEQRIFVCLLLSLLPSSLLSVGASLLFLTHYLFLLTPLHWLSLCSP